MAFWHRDDDLRDRAKQIASIMISHGFSFLVKDIGLHRFFTLGSVTGETQKVLKKRLTSEELRLLANKLPDMLEDLGPTFIKLGQFLSSRPDILPKYITDALAKLQEHVTPIPFNKIEDILAVNLPDYQQAFVSINPEPLGTASIAQTHVAELSNGKKVAIKVRKPEVMDLIELDLKILEKTVAFLAEQPEIQQLIDIEKIFAVFAHSLQKETDFYMEAENMSFFQKMLGDSGTARTPVIEWELTNETILTMEYIEGVDVEGATQLPYPDRRNLARKFIDSFLRQVFLYGIFHGDPHAGNIRFTASGEIVYLDFGIVGRIDPYMSELMIEQFLALAKMDVESMMHIAVEMGQPIGRTNWQNFYEDMAELMFTSQRIAQGNIEAGKLLRGVIHIALRNGIRMPDRLILLGKAFALAESNARRIDPEVNLLEVAEPIIKEFISKHIKPSLDEASVLANVVKLKKKFNIMFNEIPSFLSGLTRGEKKIPLEISGLDFIGDKLDKSVNRIAYSIIIASMMLAAAIMLHSSGNSPLQGAIHYTGYYLLIAALGATIYLYFKIFRQVKK